MHVITTVLAAGIFIGILNGSGMSNAMGVWLADLVPSSMGSHWALVTALASDPGTFMLSNDALYLGVLPVLAQTGASYGFTPMQIGLAATTGQAFHLLSPLVGFIYLLLHLTGIDMGAWQRTAAKWSIGTFLIFLFSIARGVPVEGPSATKRRGLPATEAVPIHVRWPVHFRRRGRDILRMVDSAEVHRHAGPVIAFVVAIGMKHDGVTSAGSGCSIESAARRTRPPAVAH